MKTRIVTWCVIALNMCAFAVHANEMPIEIIRKANITGGLIAQVGSDNLGLKELGDRFHVRLLLPDAAAVAKAQAAIQAAGLPGRFTVAEWRGGRLPFADRVLNALIVAKDGLVSEAEAQRALAPHGLLISPAGAKKMPVPPTVDVWTHYLYDASGNPVSKDQEVAPPLSLRWWAPPLHLRSHNYGAGFTGLVTDRGRLFYLLDEGTFLFDRGGTTEQWALIARDAFNGAFLWRVPLVGYGQPYFEDVAGQAVPDYIWRTPLSVNRRMVVQGDKVYAALHYRQGPLSVLDAATGKTLRDVDVGGIVDEIIAKDDLVVARVRTEIPMPDPAFTREGFRETEQKLIKEEGVPQNEARAEVFARITGRLLTQPLERVVAVDAASGKVRWQFDAPLVAIQTLAMADGKVVFHNYKELVALDAATGKVVWRFANPIKDRRRFAERNLLGNLLIADGKVLWTSSACESTVLNLADGAEVWKPKMGATGGFAFATGLRVIDDTIYGDLPNKWNTFGLSDGKPRSVPEIGDMLKRGHHVRCFAGKATERFLILPHRGAEYVDLKGDQHMVNDWFRGACGYGLMPANGLTYATPDPCSCYAGARIFGFIALSATGPKAEEEKARLEKGPAFAENQKPKVGSQSAGWLQFRADARRTSRASAPLSAKLQPAWQQSFPGALAQATIADGRAYLVNKSTYELHCLNLGDGKPVWTRPFPAALDGPPTVVGDRLYIGCGDGWVYALAAADGRLAWRFLAAPSEALTLGNDRLENVVPVFSSVLFHNGLIYVVAGRNSYLDGGVLLYALDPATGAVRHERKLSGPWPDKETLRKAVVGENELDKMKESSKAEEALKILKTQYATGYHVEGAQADVLVTDGTDLYLMQNKLTPALEQVPLNRIYHTGLTSMGGKHLLSNFGFLNDTMNHRSYRMYDEIWPGYGGGSGWAARAGTMVVVGETKAYAAKHYEGGWYPTHKPGNGNKLVADTFDHVNTAGALADKALLEKFKQYGNPSEIVRTDAPVWETTVPVIIRAMLVAPDGQGGELVFSGGIVEGKTKEEWDKSTAYIGPGKLLVHNGADGKLLAEYDLPACPIFDGMSAAEGKLLIPMVNGQVQCLAIQ